VRKRSLSLFILFLILGVAARELPECFSLADDVSNDGIVATYRDQSAPGGSSLRNDLSEASTGPDRILPISTSHPRPVRGHPLRRAKTGPDLLVLLSLQRK
jgi:hypothetical protein